ncbi:unnamed protein product, partial [Didymodactylos carnosus]
MPVITKMSFSDNNNTYRSNMNNNKDDESSESIQRQIHQYKNSMLDRSHHMVNLVSESEQLGINTATELATQREKLEKIDNNLDTIDNTLIGTQQRINRLQSVFGGIKNYFYGPKTAFLPKSNSQPNMTKNQSNNTSSNKQQQQRISL